jgi:hypothetical protein
MRYTVHMPQVRTQIYLTEAQRKKLSVRGQREGKALAELVREALDRDLKDEPEDPRAVLASTFGACPRLRAIPWTEWGRGYG